jgi:CTP synthase
LTTNCSKYIFVTGGVVSSLGKGIASASLGLLLKSRGIRVTSLKIDPYINVDPGTMSPYQHGEVFVTEDGAETDLDLGHYERFLDVDMGKANNFTTGAVYGAVIERERQGGYLGKTVQVIPHLTDEIKKRIRLAARNAKDVDVILVELGGTVGDIEGLPFLEAIRQLRLEEPFGHCLNIHLTLVPFIQASQEIKTKPSQHSVQKLREIGIQPDFLICRTESPLPRDAREKIALYANLPVEAVIEARDAETIYEVPLNLERQGLADLVVRRLKLQAKPPALTRWKTMVDTIKRPKRIVRIAIAGKYVELRDAYKSILEAFTHAGVANSAKVEPVWVSSEDIEKKGAAALLSDVSGLLIPGGFGERGIDGKVQAVQFARENDLPFFGICLGMQVAVIEYARNVCGIKAANSREFDEGAVQAVIDYMPGQNKQVQKGGTMRLGAYPCMLRRGTLAQKVYGKDRITERHRHRFEINNEYRTALENEGMVLSGVSPDHTLVEIIELPGKRWFLAGQFHPEFKSRALQPHPLFASFVKAALAHMSQKKKGA